MLSKYSPEKILVSTATFHILNTWSSSSWWWHCFLFLILFIIWKSLLYTMHWDDIAICNRINCNSSLSILFCIFFIHSIIFIVIPSVSLWILIWFYSFWNPLGLCSKLSLTFQSFYFEYIHSSPFFIQLLLILDEFNIIFFFPSKKFNYLNHNHQIRFSSSWYIDLKDTKD